MITTTLSHQALFRAGSNVNNCTVTEKLSGDRVLLYLCPECGDIGCGAYSVQTQESDEHFIRDLFAYENGYEEPRIIKGIGPFTFEKQSYEAAITGASALCLT
ncbi:hypothetical protein KJF94_14715 [Pseudomonas hormoni]|uniref:Uncharacterized protein n=1 Tax=Pseudomonas hormoni TaxID=3093767 RepID=A0ABX8F733_9PSED|nr:hypothetical protein [Pseudomonas hormoni]QVW26707.1 hypothetical protein KJF94_14715 [Pseudomonas hormoni]